jgi:transmembrane sensor
MTPDTNKIDEVAAYWAVRCANAALSLHEQREFDAWRAADSRHQGAYVRARTMWMDLDRIGALKHAGANGSAPPAPAQVTRRQWLMAASVAAVAIMVGAGAWLTLKNGGETYVSQIGEMRRVKLEDGSSMMLNTASKAVARFDESQREIQLEEGEAIFEVAKDTQRPFVVRVGSLDVKAVGTAFAVRRDPGRVNVMVTEGVVELLRTDGGQAESVQRLTANQAAELTGTDLRVLSISEAEAERRLAWRRGMVAFDGQTLGEAVAEVNRHSTRRIVIDDPALARRPIIGIFRATDINTFAQTAATVLGADTVDDGDIIRIRTKTTR